MNELPSFLPKLSDLLRKSPASQHVWTIGYDVGQVRDPSALVVAEALPTPSGRTLHARPCDAAASVPRGQSFCNDKCADELVDTFRIHDLGRLPLGTRYPEQVASVREVIARVNLRGAKPYVHVDVTGVGRPVADTLRDGLDGTDYYLSAVSITSGTTLKPQGLGAPEVSVGKERLVSRLQVLLDHGRILLAADDKESRALVRELQTFELRAQASGMKAGAFKTGTHDDLAVALGLAVLYEPSRSVVRYFKVPWA
jgi:hypothetical protein